MLVRPGEYSYFSLLVSVFANRPFASHGSLELYSDLLKEGFGQIDGQLFQNRCYVLQIEGK